MNLTEDYTNIHFGYALCQNVIATQRHDIQLP